MVQSNNKPFRTSFFNTLHGRFLLALILVGIVPFSLIGFTVINIETRALNEQSTRELTSLARGLSGQLNTFLSELLRDSQAIASLPEIAAMDAAQQDKLLKDLYVHYFDYGQLAVADLSGQLLVVANPQELVNISKVASFQQAAKGQQGWVIAPGLFNDTLILHIHTPIRSENNQLVGVLGSPVPLGIPANILAEMDIGGHGQAFVLDEMGKVLLHPDPAMREARRSYAEWIDTQTVGLVNSVGTARYEIDGEVRIAGYAPIPNFGWTVVVERPESEVLAPVVTTRTWALAGLLMSILLSLIAAILLARRLTRPVRNLAAAAQALGAGNANAPLPTNTSEDAEIDMLVQAFSTMREAVIDREEGLRRSEARVRALTHAIPDILFRVRRDGNIIDAKVPFISNLPLGSTAEIVKTNFYQFIYTFGVQGLAQRFVNGFEQTLRTGVIQVVESQLNVNGRLTDFEARYVVSSEDEVLIMLRNITERKQAEAAIRKHISAMEASSDGMAILDHNQLYTYVNDAYIKIHGYAHAQELIGKPWRTCYTLEEFKRIAKEVISTAHQTGVWRGESLGKRRDNSIYFQEISLTLIETGEFVCIVRDITQRKESEEALRQAQKLESLGVLAGGIAHDFNNLLTGMLGHASIVQATLPEESPSRDQLERLMQSAEAAADLTRQLLAYAGKGQFAVRLLNLNKSIRENAGLIETAIPRRATLDLDLQENIPLIKGDRGQIQQIVMNLVINAAESLYEQGGKVCIRTNLYTITPTDTQETELIGGEKLLPGSYVILEVQDTGQGMSRSTIERIFDPFFTTKNMGHGLGLSATLGIIRTHHGGVQVESTPEKGSLFRIFFPASDEHEDDNPTLRFNPQQQYSGKVLVIDDEASVRRVAEDMLTVMGMSAIMAHSGEHGLELYETHKENINLVLLDMKMPGIDGEETYRRLVKLNPAVKVIVASGYSEAEDLSAFLEQNAIEFLHKPFALSTLGEKVQKILSTAVNSSS